MKAAWVFLGAILGPTGPSDHFPPRLRNILDSKMPTTSQIEWTATWIGGRDDGLVERYVTRKAGDAIWESNLGDERGFHEVVYRASDANSEDDLRPHQISKEGPPVMDEEWLRTHEIPKEETAGTRNSLIHDGRVWHLHYAERPLTGDVQPIETARAWLPVDLPSIGLAPCGRMSGLEAKPFQLPEWALEGFDSATFAQGMENGAPTVSAIYGAGRFRLTWRFDERYGGQPVWSAFERDGVPVYSSETEYEKIGERWFPKSARFYQSDSTTPYKMIDVQRATFDEPWHMQEITPTEIGALYGTHFAASDGAKMWTGAELIPLKEYFDLVELYGVLPDPKIVELKARMINKTVDEYLEIVQRGITQRREEYRKKYGEEPWLDQKPGKEKDEWDVYVEKFLAEHKLPPPGVKRAHEIRDQAKKLRDAYRRKNRAALKEAKEKNDQRKIEHYERLEKRIFDQVLVRELKKLVHDDKASTKQNP